MFLAVMEMPELVATTVMFSPLRSVSSQGGAWGVP